MQGSGRPPSAGCSIIHTAFVFAFAILLAMPALAQSFTKLVDFNGSNGDNPGTTVLVQGTDGKFYGTTVNGGTNNRGVAFQMTSGGSVRVLHSFSTGADGTPPQSGLVLGSDGNFYGTTRGGGSHCCGTVFKITPAGVLTTLYNFNITDGSGPLGQLVQGSDGNFYGTTYAGGAYGYGEIFRITPSGTLNVMYSFCPSVPCVNGRSPEAGVMQANDGNFYGTTQYGGDDGQGIIFKITPGGTFTRLHSFTFVQGSAPASKLVQGRDGSLYGTAFLGGDASVGTIFKITLGGTFTRLYSFCTQLDCSTGSEPVAGLIQGSDGNFYGVTTVAGAHSHGTVFKMTPGGTVTALYSFCTDPAHGCPDGAGPQGALVQATDGNFYGTTSGGGANSKGTAFRVTGPALVPTTTTLTTSPNPSHLGQNVAMTATVHAQNGTQPWGYAYYYSDGAFIGIAQLNTSGVAVLNYSGLTMGTHNIMAIYQGGNGYARSTSNTVQQMVTFPQSTTTVTSAPNPSTFGDQVTITATVGPSGPPMPTGTVSFTSNGVAISGCTGVALSNLMAQCVTSALAVGTDAIVATYSGDNNYAGSSGMLTQFVNPVPTPVQFVPITPCRMVDTRHANGTFGGPILAGNSTRDFPFTQANNPCGIPPSAVAYSVNVAVVPVHSLGYLTIWPSGQGRPVVATLNSDGRVKANAAIVSAGTPSGSISVYVTDSTHVIIDINGYFTATQGAYQFYPLAPCRVVDTRQTQHPPPPGLGPPSLSNGETRPLPVQTSPCFQNLPRQPKAYSFNVAVVPPPHHPLNYLTMWSGVGTLPVVSTLNNPRGTVVANAAIVPAAPDGSVAVYTTDATDLIIDVNGYFGDPSPDGLSYYTVAPCRAYDSRRGDGPFQGTRAVPIAASQCSPPAGAGAYVFNAAVVPTNGSLGYLTLWPGPEDMRPQVATLNAYDGAITSNMAIVPNLDGTIDAYADKMTHLILDITGYFAP